MSFSSLFLWKIVSTTTTVLIFHTTHFFCDAVSSREWDTGELQNESSLSVHLFFIIIGSVTLFLFLVVFLIPVCMDCMNSEVSSDTNPACGSTTPKWGGDSNYAANEVRVPVTPTHAHEGSGFIGYQAAGYPAPPAASDGSGPGGQFQRHFSPFDQEPPPPPYEAAVTGSR